MIKQLESKFGDPQKNLTSHLNRLYALPLVTENDLNNLTRYVEVVEGYHAALGVTAPREIKSKAHFHVLSSKVDPKLMVQYRKTMTTLGIKENDDPKALLMYLKEYVIEPIGKIHTDHGKRREGPEETKNPGNKRPREE